jgi:hypothetical protein
MQNQKNQEEKNQIPMPKEMVKLHQMACQRNPNDPIIHCRPEEDQSLKKDLHRSGSSHVTTGTKQKFGLDRSQLSREARDNLKTQVKEMKRALGLNESAIHKINKLIEEAAAGSTPRPVAPKREVVVHREGLLTRYQKAIQEKIDDYLKKIRVQGKQAAQADNELGPIESTQGLRQQYRQPEAQAKLINAQARQAKLAQEAEKNQGG